MAVEVRELTCVVCPLGCRLAVALEAGVVVSVTGNTCPRGEAYGREEVVNPVRTVTTTVSIDGAGVRRLPVRTASPVPKASVPSVIAALAALRLDAPVALGAVVAVDVAGTGVDVVATRSLDRVAS